MDKGSSPPPLAGGQFYVVETGRYFADQRSVDDHKKSRFFKRRLKELREEKPYSQDDAEAAAGSCFVSPQQNRGDNDLSRRNDQGEAAARSWRSAAKGCADDSMRSLFSDKPLSGVQSLRPFSLRRRQRRGSLQMHSARMEAGPSVTAVLPKKALFCSLGWRSLGPRGSPPLMMVPSSCGSFRSGSTVVVPVDQKLGFLFFDSETSHI